MITLGIFMNLGRAGTYLYAIEMDDCVEQALDDMILLNQACAAAYIFCNAIKGLYDDTSELLFITLCLSTNSYNTRTKQI